MVEPPSHGREIGVFYLMSPTGIIRCHEVHGQTPGAGGRAQRTGAHSAGTGPLCGRDRRGGARQTTGAGQLVTGGGLAASAASFLRQEGEYSTGEKHA